MVKKIQGQHVSICSDGMGVGSQEMYYRSSGCIQYIAELMAILLALQWVEEVKPDRVVICSDSCAVLMSLQSFSSRSRQDLLYDVLQTHGRIRQISRSDLLGSQPMWG